MKTALAIVRRLGPPDFLVTVTCNSDLPKFIEAVSIKFDDNLIIEQSSQNSPDLYRIPKFKFENIINDIGKEYIFGKVAAYLYTIEFQKTYTATYASAIDNEPLGSNP